MPMVGDVDTTATEVLTDDAIIRALHVCDGLVTAAIGYLRGRHGVWVSRSWLVRRIAGSAVISDCYNSFSESRREMCEEVVLASAKSGNVRSAVWYLEHVYPDQYCSSRPDDRSSSDDSVREIAVTKVMTQEDWVKAFSGMRAGGGKVN